VATTPTEALGLHVFGITLVDVGCPGEVVDHGRLRAVVRLEPLAQYEPEALEAKLRDDRSWLEQQLRDHDAVLSAVQAAGPLVPFRFGTIFRSEEELRAVLAASEGQLARRLEELRGAAEWGVKTWVDGPLLRRWLEEHDDHARSLRAGLDAPDLPAGRRYLLEKQLDRHVANEAACLALERAHEAHAMLAEHARESRTDRPSGYDEHGDQWPVLRAAYLLEDERREAFEQALEIARRRDAELGLGYALSGPWPPYNFVDPPGA
jgi:hypothetical protein